MNEIIPQLIKLPPAVRGVVHPDENGDYIIFINSYYSPAECRAIYRHEMRHVLLNHFSIDTLSIYAIEGQADDDDSLQDEIEAAARYGISVHNIADAQAKVGLAPQPKAPPPADNTIAFPTPESLLQELQDIRREMEAEFGVPPDSPNARPPGGSQ